MAMINYAHYIESFCMNGIIHAVYIVSLCMALFFAAAMLRPK